ncbi:unnamed protein product, partial [Prorocentrum cordatum]
MSSVARWSRFYRTTAPRRGQVALLAMRMYPKKKTETRWIYVEPDRALGVGDIKDRTMLSRRRQHGWNYDAFPALAAIENSEILERAKEKKLEAELHLSNLRRWAVAKLDDGQNLLLEVYDFSGHPHDLYWDGKLELPILFFAGMIEPATDVDSDGKAGHSVAASSDESEPSKDAQEMKAMTSSLLDEITRAKVPAGLGRLSIAPTEPSMDMHVDKMIDRLKKFEDTISADRAIPNRKPLQGTSSTTATAESTACPTLDFRSPAVPE